jgi:hypothetical protein
MKKIIAIFFILFTILSYSQSKFERLNDTQALENLWFKTTFNQEEREVEGSPYYYKEFQLVNINDYNEKIPARYNIYNDTIEFQKNGKTMVMPKSELYTHFAFETGEIIELIDDGYFILVYSGKNANLLKKSRVSFQAFKKATSGYTADKPAKFIISPEEYFIQLDGKMEEFPKNQKDFANLFPNKKDEILKHLNQNKNKLKTESEMKIAMNYINSLK